MFHFEYVSKQEVQTYRNIFEEIIKAVQTQVRPEFTFQYKFIGSSERNMITFDPTTSIGFDFDVNLYINDENEDYSAKEIKLKLINAINMVARPKGFNHCEDSTRVITLKMVNPIVSRIQYSCDFAIVNDYTDDDGIKHQQYIRLNKNTGSYAWENQSKGYMLDSKIAWIKNQQLWNDVRELYIWKKNNQIDLNKKSRALYAETIHEICQKSGFFEE